MLYPLSYGGQGSVEVTSRRFSLRPLSRRASLVAVTQGAPHAGRAVRVLVVDDSDVIRTLISVNLEMEGFEVMTAADGQEALEIVHEVAPDVMTIDVKMPRMDGFDTVAALRADPRTRGLKVAMVTACAQDADVRRGQEVGVDAFVTKPFDPSTLVRTVRDLVEQPPG